MRFPQRPPGESPTFSPEDWLATLRHFRPDLEDGRYLHWDELRRLRPPSGLDHHRWWFATTFGRVAKRTIVPGLRDKQGEPFWFCSVDALARATHELDRRDASRAFLEALGDEVARTEHRFDQLVEEAISSSLIEGARITTRAAAKAMIRDEREPTSHGERMIRNNFLAMTRLLELVDEELTIDHLLEIHAILGRDALDVASAEGRFRTASETVHVVDSVSGEIWHDPPAAAELGVRMGALLAFANGREATDAFIHPLLRAMILHFWLAYVHPFVDGNGRMARALFYWQMLRSGYDFARYLSISGPIDRSKRAYYMAFAHSETSGGDLTYFVLNQLQVLNAATNDLTAHLAERGRQMRAISVAITASESLTHRQRAALETLVRDPQEGLVVKGHAHAHGVTYLTARKDLQDLEREGLVRRVRVGRTDRYFAAIDLVARVRDVRGGSRT